MAELAQRRLSDILCDVAACCDSVQPANPDRCWDIANELLPLLQQAVVHCRQLDLHGEADQLIELGSSLHELRHEIAMNVLAGDETPEGIAELLETYGPFHTPTGNRAEDEERQSLRQQALVGSIVQVGQYARSLRRTIRKTLKQTAVNGQYGDVLTPPQVAKLLGVDPSTVIGWIRARQLKASNVGQGGKRPRFRIQRSDLESFMQSREPLPAVATKQRRAKQADDDIEYIR